MSPLLSLSLLFDCTRQADSDFSKDIGALEKDQGARSSAKQHLATEISFRPAVFAIDPQEAEPAWVSDGRARLAK